MKTFTLFAALVSSAAFAQGIPIKSGASTDLATVNTNKSLLTSAGRSSSATYICAATGLAASAAYSMQLNAEAGKTIRVQRICIGSSSATAAAAQTITIQRRTTASTGGTAATAEGTASPSVSKLDQAEAAGNFSGVCAVTPTLGTAGAIIGGWSLVVPALASGFPEVYCRDYGQGGKEIIVSAGVSNGISVSATSAGVGGLASGSITITFVSE